MLCNAWYRLDSLQCLGCQPARTDKGVGRLVMIFVPWSDCPELNGGTALLVLVLKRTKRCFESDGQSDLCLGDKLRVQKCFQCER